MKPRHIVGAVLFFFISVSPAFANVTNLSNDPVFAQQFIFYCQPYGSSFENGKHYIAQDGKCTYSVPSTLSGTKQLLLLKGVPGVGASIVGGDTVTFATTLVAQNPNSFGGTVAEDPFFAVVYNASLNSGPEPLVDYLTGATSTLPSAVVEGTNFYQIEWLWGATPASELVPVILVPDILNTWQTDSGPVVDPLFNLYRNLIDTFTANGYVLEETLFTFPYDWRQSNLTSAAELDSFIQSVKSTCTCDKVDLVGHGMGGLITTQYLEDTGPLGDVSRSAFIGTPHFGVPASYLAWGGGQINLGNALQSGLGQSLLRQEALNSGYAGVYHYLQGKPAPSFLELLPAESYITGKSYPTGYPQNTFLENLLSNLSVTFSGSSFYLNGARLIGAIGGGQTTTSGFSVTTSTNPPLWPHGQPTVTQTMTGDGMVTDNGVFLFDHSYTAAHNALPTLAAGDLFTEFTNRAPTTVVSNSYPVSCVLFLSTTPTVDLLLTDPNNLRLGKDIPGSGVLNEIPSSLYSGYNQQTEYIAVANPVQGTYTVQTQGSSSGSFTITATDVCGTGTVSTSTSATTTPGQIIGYEVTVDPDAGTLDIEELDATAPIVTIITPADGASYYTTDVVLADVTIVDPDSSPLGLATYELNGAPVNPLDPLPLSTQPLGAATLVVEVSDVFGNTGYATSTFTIEEPPPMWPQFGNFLPPITAKGHTIDENTSVFKAGSNVPVKFELVDENGSSVQDSGLIVWIEPVRGPVLSTTATATSTIYVAPSSGNYYDWQGGHYHYGWKTAKSDKGFWYYLFVVLADGSIHQTIIGLK